MLKNTYPKNGRLTLIKVLDKNHKIRKTAFSAIEISVVLVAIGLLVAGIVITKSDIFIKASSSKLKSLTKSSPIIEMPDLAVWYEVGTKESFKASEFSEGSFISEWKDINPQNYDKMDLTQGGADTLKPTYVIDPVDGLPALSYDGGDSLTRLSVRDFDLAKKNQITIFAVRKYVSGNDYVILWSASPNRISAHLFWDADDTIYFDFGDPSGGGRASVAAPSDFRNEWKILTLVKRTDNTGVLRINGSPITLTDSTMTDDLNNNVSADTFTVGSTSVHYIREVIIFKRQMSDREIDEVEEYLSKKWDIDLT